MSTFGERMRLRREALAMSQEQLGEMIAKGQQQVSRYESGGIQPSAPAISRIAHALQTSTDYLLGVTDNPGSPYTHREDLESWAIEVVMRLRGQPDEQRERIVNAIRALTG